MWRHVCFLAWIITTVAVRNEERRHFKRKCWCCSALRKGDGKVTLQLHTDIKLNQIPDKLILKSMGDKTCIAYLYTQNRPYLTKGLLQIQIKPKSVHNGMIQLRAIAVTNKPLSCLCRSFWCLLGVWPLSSCFSLFFVVCTNWRSFLKASEVPRYFIIYQDACIWSPSLLNVSTYSVNIISLANPKYCFPHSNESTYWSVFVALLACFLCSLETSFSHNGVKSSYQAHVHLESEELHQQLPHRKHEPAE